jgi:hypothetical protein
MKKLLSLVDVATGTPSNEAEDKSRRAPVK